jgi:hypothetical protein
MRFLTCAFIAIMKIGVVVGVVNGQGILLNFDHLCRSCLTFVLFKHNDLG